MASTDKAGWGGSPPEAVEGLSFFALQYINDAMHNMSSAFGIGASVFTNLFAISGLKIHSKP